MKRFLLVAVLFVFAAGSANAQLPPKPYIGLYADGSHSLWCATGAMPFYQVTMWVWALSTDDSLLCAEFAVSYPASGIIASTTTANPEYSVILGDLGTGMSICFQSCQYGWTWLFQQALFVNEADKKMIQIVPHGASGVVQVAPCPAGAPEILATVFTNLYVNAESGTDVECDQTGVEPKSWGAIKRMLE
ncbi:MAG: hypothetical protein JW876_01930 [Candidatus Krumholzibacteriota bacterium]|nr:hypothetical protein [Candidatus Krumholzibacteriota bacterium]